MVKIPKYIVSLVGLAIIITLQQLITSINFQVLSFFLWLSSFALVIHLIIIGVYFFLDTDLEDPKPLIVNKLFLGSKLIIGFGLLLCAIVFCIDFIIERFNYWKYLNYKLFVPFGILFVIGRSFIREKEVKLIIKKTFERGIPIVNTSFIILEEKSNILGQWVMSKKWLVGLIGILLLLLFTLPMLFKSPVKEPIMVTLHVLDSNYFEIKEDSVVIERDYDQRVHLRVTNMEPIAKHVFFEVTQESGDSLMVGFVGKGSRYENVIKSEFILAGFSQDFDLLIHSAQSQETEYKFSVKLYEADSVNTKGAQILDQKELTVNINQGELNIEFFKTYDEPFSLAQTYEVRNNGTLISDFSLIPDSVLSKQVHIRPRIANFRFKENTTLAFTIEPVLHIGFDGLEGKLYGQSGGTLNPKIVPVSFNVPERKKMYLAVSDCGSNSTTRICECTNQGRTRVAVSTPSENNGPYTPPGERRGRRNGLDPPITFPPPEDLDQEKPDLEDEYDEPVPAVEKFEPYKPEFAEKDEILKDARALKDNLEAAQDEFDDTGISRRIKGAIDQVDDIIRYVSEENELSEETIQRVNKELPKPYKVFDEIVGNQGNNRARTDLIASVNSTGINGTMNLRFNGKVASLNNAAVPTIYFSNNNSHFAWHEPPRYDGDEQRVFYSRHSLKGPVEITQREMNIPSSGGRWPMVIEGHTNQLFYVWQGKSASSNYNVLFRKSNDNGKTWSSPYAITNHGKGVFAPRLSFYNNTIYAYWIDYSGQVSKLFVSYSTDNGELFTEPIEISATIKPKGVLKMVQNGDDVFFLYEVTYTNQKTYVICQKVSRQNIHNGKGSDFETDKRVIIEGSQPAGIVDKNNRLHIAYVKNNTDNRYRIGYFSGDVSRVLTGVPSEFINKTFSRTQGYNLSPSLMVNANELQLMYHAGEVHHGQFIDHLQIKKMNINTQVWDAEAVRLPALSPNAERVYLSVQFDLPWSRSVYDKHDVKILLNGWVVAHLKKTVPEGKMLFSVPSRILKYDGDRTNIVTLETVGFNPAAYLAASEIKLISDLSFMEQFVFASSQREADSLLYSRKEYNHTQPDLGFYSTIKTSIPDSISDGDQIMLNLDLWNLGQGPSTESRIDVFGATFDIDNSNLQDRNLLKQLKLGDIKPFEKRSMEIPIRYWAGLEKIVVKITSKEKDFDLSNNTFSTVLINPKDNLYTPKSRNSLLRVAVYDTPGVLAEGIYFELINPNSSVSVDHSDTNPVFWRPEVGIYNIHMRSKEDDSFEQLISGIPITNKYDAYNNVSRSSNLSLDIQLKNKDKLIETLEATRDGSIVNFELPSALLFEVNESTINLYAFDYLKKVVYLMTAYPKSTIIVEGHTDAQGGPTMNMNLSKKRAQTVSDWLVKTGNFNANRFTILGAGATNPVATNTTEEGRIKNRRVIFKLNLNE